MGQPDPSDAPAAPVPGIEMDRIAPVRDRETEGAETTAGQTSNDNDDSTPFPSVAPEDEPDATAPQPQQPRTAGPAAATTAAATTVGDERRASIAGPNASSRSLDSLGRRLSRSFQESELPRGFLAATADMTSSVVAAARPRSGTARTRSSTVSDLEERSSNTKTLQQQRTPSKGDGSALLATLDEHHKRASASFDLGGRDDDDDAKAGGVGVGVLQQENQQRGPARSGDGGTTSDSTTAVTVTAAGSLEVGGATDGGAAAALAGDDKPYGEAYDNGYHFPPRYSKGESFRHGLRAFWHYACTPVGFLVVVYGLNVVAWGGMLFLLLCEASPAMCHPTCADFNSPRRKWIEVDSQILNALFCVTGFGLAPWRFRDFYFYLQFWLAKNPRGLRRLAGVHRGWLRLPGSDALPPATGPGNIPHDTPCDAIPFPESSIPDAPLTGRRAPPTRLWRIVFILVMNVGNTLLQVVLCGFMWGMNRRDRPSWATGVFVALGCVAGALGGLGMFVEGKRVKSIEGVPLTDEDRAKLEHDRQLGIYHYNNLKGKAPKEKPADVEAGTR